MSKSRKSEEQREKEMELTLAARDALGGKKRMTRPEFGRLTGRSKSVIYKRDTEGSGVPGGAATLYHLIIRVCDVPGMRRGLVETLDSIPDESRSEGKALMAATIFAMKNGLENLVEQVNEGDFEFAGVGDEEDSVDRSGHESIALLRNIQRNFEEKARKAKGKEAERLEKAATNMATVIYEAEQAQAEAERAKEPEES